MVPHHVHVGSTDESVGYKKEEDMKIERGILGRSTGDLGVERHPVPTCGFTDTVHKCAHISTHRHTCIYRTSPEIKVYS